MTSRRTVPTSRSSWRTRDPWRRSSARSPRRERRSIRCKSPSRPWRTSSSAWSGGAWIERGDGATHGPSISRRTQPTGGRRPLLPAYRRREPRALVDFLRGVPSPPRNRGVCVHLPILWTPGDGRDPREPSDVRRPYLRECGRAESIPRSGERQHERTDCVRRPWRDDGRLLAERAVVDGEPAVLGERDREPAALHDGADEPHGAPRWHGRRRDGHDLDAGRVDPRCGHLRLRGHLPSRESAPAARRFLCHVNRPIRSRDDVRLAVPPLGTGGVEPIRPDGGADLLLERFLLPAWRVIPNPRLGTGRRDCGIVHPRVNRARCAATAYPGFDRLRRLALDF